MEVNPKTQTRLHFICDSYNNLQVYPGAYAPKTRKTK